MCGITGGWWLTPPRDLQNRILCSQNKLGRRGPDDRGSELLEVCNGRLALAHTRLSVIDLSPAGRQPMLSGNGRHRIVFNGEIYNYRELRQELAGLGHVFHTNTDTEVLLAAWQQWDIQCLTRLEGMFAFVIYDAQEKTLSCVRDAFGIKPFYFDLQADRLLFASEPAALLSLREQGPQANWQRSYDYLVHGDADNQHNTFIKGIQQLQPGHWIKIDLSDPGASQPALWWEPNLQENSDLSFEQAAEAVREQFLQNIRLHLRSDVPLGAALSGGIDSSAIVCAMHYLEPSQRINTFSYIAPGYQRCEESWMDNVNQFVGAKSHKVSIDSNDVTRDLDRLIQAQGEPFTGTSTYAQYRVFQLAHENDITVTLDGQGADELLAGYAGFPGHRMLSMLECGDLLGAERFARNWARWPGRSYSRAWQYLAAITLPDNLFGVASKAMGRSFTPAWLNSRALSDAGVNMVYEREKKHKSAKGRRVMERLASSLSNRNLPTYLREGDRSSMHFSLESRVPFLTLPLANLLFSLPEHYLISPRGETKSVFRAALRGIVPDTLLDRKDKIGFETSEQAWFMEKPDTVRKWLETSHDIPFLNGHALLEQFDAIVGGTLPNTGQVWRWVNFLKWHEQIGCSEYSYSTLRNDKHENTYSSLHPLRHGH
ncbi:asparagine synthase (glutamine-hydrolyzing) [Alcaligenaceae bacterium]|nr:asparagine synthase (glutamine-hydrolyzing) [Alcaligenaceae bacterium]